MVRINKVRFAGWIVLLLALFWLGGCTTSMQARSAFEEARRILFQLQYED